MNKYAVINLKIDPRLKERSAKVASRLGVSISAILNNELRRLAIEKSVTFEWPEVPNAATAAHLKNSRIQIQAGDYHYFNSNKAALDFLANKLE